MHISLHCLDRTALTVTAFTVTFKIILLCLTNKKVLGVSIDRRYVYHRIFSIQLNGMHIYIPFLDSFSML